MANVIKHKRGSGSDPVASDLVVGEVAIRTDVGKLFTKMDNGSVAEIAGGGSDIAINTLSSSSGTGGGSATFNGSAYRFTLSAPPSVSAQQLLVSINGVIQKPVAGTGQPSEGFSVDGTDIILGDAPATGSDFFILTFKSLGVSEPADNTVTSAKIVNGTIVNADINASAAIAGTKISPNFGTQDLLINGKISIDNSNELAVFEANTSLGFTNSAKLSFDFLNNIARIRSSGNGSFSAARPLTLNILNTEVIRIDTNNRVGIGTTSPANALDVQGGATNTAIVARSTDSKAQISLVDNSTTSVGSVAVGAEGDALFLTSGSGGGEAMRIDSSGNVGIGTASPSQKLQVTSGNILLDGTDQFIYLSNDSDQWLSANAASNYLRIGTGNAERMRIDSSGRVGIGTTSPAKLLDVKSESNNTESVYVIRNQTVNLIGKVATTDHAQIGTETSHDFVLLTSNGERMRIRADGNVGINESSPLAKFHVKVADSGASAYAHCAAVFEDSDHTFIDIMSGTSGSGGINFGDSGGSQRGVLEYDHNSDFMRLIVAGGERMRIDSSGNVGIGTTSPQNLLHIHEGSSASSVIQTTNTTTGSSATDGFQFGINSSEQAFFHMRESAPILFTINGSERMRIDSSGRVGIGTSNPLNMIHTSAANDASGIRMTNTFDSPDNVWALLPSISGVSNTGFTIRDVTDGANRLVINGSGNVGINQTNPNKARLHVVGDDTDGDIVAKFKSGSGGANSTAFIALISGYPDTANDLEGHAYIGVQRAGSGNNSRLLFQTYGGGSSLTTKMTISEGGNIGAPSGTNIYNASDERLKKNVVDIDKGLSAINLLRPVSFNWIDGFCDEEKETLYGFIAQEVQAVDTNLIQNFSQELTVKDNTINDVLRVNEKFIIPMLVKAVQELTARLEALEAK